MLEERVNTGTFIKRRNSHTYYPIVPNNTIIFCKYTAIHILNMEQKYYKILVINYGVFNPPHYENKGAKLFKKLY